MRRYGISLEEISSVLEKPDTITPTIKGRYNAVRQMGRSIIRVTYRDEGRRLVIVTVSPRRRA